MLAECKKSFWHIKGREFRIVSDKTIIIPLKLPLTDTAAVPPAFEAPPLVTGYDGICGKNYQCNSSPYKNENFMHLPLDGIGSNALRWSVSQGCSCEQDLSGSMNLLLDGSSTKKKLSPSAFGMSSRKKVWAPKMKDGIPISRKPCCKPFLHMSSGENPDYYGSVRNTKSTVQKTLIRKLKKHRHLSN